MRLHPGLDPSVRHLAWLPLASGGRRVGLAPRPGPRLSPQAYKDIETVIAAQNELVEIIGKFTPRIVRMADEAGDH
jgi:hypothetical protein